MRFTQPYLAVGVIIVSMALPSSSWAKSELDLRLTRLENIVENELNIGLLNQLEAMQQEIRELRGKLEEQQNAIQGIDQKQEKLFLNLDNRVNNLTAPTATDEDLFSTSENSLYDTAYALMSNKKYPEAITAFKDQIWQFPEGAYAASAYYWIGEIYLLQSLLEQAKESFTIVTNKYQGDPREIDSLLKLGMIEIDLGNWDAAKIALNQVITKQPNSSRARIAASKLQSITQ